MATISLKEVQRLTEVRYHQTYGKRAPTTREAWSPLTRQAWAAERWTVVDMLRSVGNTVEGDHHDVGAPPPVSPLAAPIAAQIKTLRAHPAYVDKNHREHEEIVTKVSELYALGEQFDEGGEA